MRTQRDKIAVADQQLVEKLEEQNQSTSVSTQVSERKMAANKQNAQKSTGPTTVAGKARSSWNATKHGLLAKCAVIVEYEDEKEFNHLLRALRSQIRPCGVIEEFLVERIAESYWNLGRIAKLKRLRLAEWVMMKKKTESVMSMVHANDTIEYATEEHGDTAASWLQEHGWENVARIWLEDSGECTWREVDAMSGDEAIRRFLRVKAEAKRQHWPKHRDILDNTSDNAITDEDFQKYHHYETTIENRLYKALHELERLQRLRGGQFVTAPLIIESNQ